MRWRGEGVCGSPRKEDVAEGRVWRTIHAAGFQNQGECTPDRAKGVGLQPPKPP